MSLTKPLTSTSTRRRCRWTPPSYVQLVSGLSCATGMPVETAPEPAVDPIVAPAGEVRRVGFESVAGQTQRPQVGDVRRAKTATDLSRDVEPLSQRDYGPEARRDGVGGQLIVRPQSLAVDQRRIRRARVVGRAAVATDRKSVV